MGRQAFLFQVVDLQTDRKQPKTSERRSSYTSIQFKE